MSRVVAYLSLGLSSFLIGLAFASPTDPSTAFAEANKLYDQTRYSDAAKSYQELVRSGYHHPTVYFNLGNAYFKSGQIGRALAAYHLAEREAPRDPDLRANLQFARNQVQGPSNSRAHFERWLRKLTVNEWTMLTAAGLWMTLSLGIAMQFGPGLRRSLRWYLGSSALATLVLGGCLAAACQARFSHRTGFVVVRDANVRLGPLDEQQTAFVLHDGAEVEILDRKDDWLQVTTGNRRVGWVRQDQVLELPRG